MGSERSYQLSRPPVNEDWDAAVGAARFFTDGKLHGAAPAPYRAPYLDRTGIAEKVTGARFRPA